MDQQSIKNVMSPANKFDEVNKAYADDIKYKTATGSIPDTVMTDHTLFTFPASKAFSSGKIEICEMWVERLADEWIATSSPMFATAWPGFHKLFRGPSLMTFFTGSPPVVGLAIFAWTKISNPSLSLPSNHPITPTDSARNLGFIFDSSLNFSKQISSLSSACNYHIRDLRRIRHTLDLKTASVIATSLVHFKLDYCNSLYLNLPQK